MIGVLFNFHLRAQKRFQDFLEEWKAEGSDELKYLNDARELNEHSRNTIQVRGCNGISLIKKICQQISMQVVLNR